MFAGHNDTGQGAANISKTNTVTFSRVGTSQIKGNLDFVACGNCSTSVIATDGATHSLHSTGGNDSGQLGLPTSAKQYVTLKPVLLGDVVYVYAHDKHSLAIVQESSEVTVLYAFGYNNKGQLGLGNTVQPQDPKKVTIPGKVLKAVCGVAHSLALTLVDGAVALYAWGDNKFGQLGLGVEDASRSTPQKVTLQGEILDIACGAQHSMAVTRSGNEVSLYAWGDNGAGQLGVGNQTPKSAVPVKVTLPGNIALEEGAGSSSMSSSSSAAAASTSTSTSDVPQQ